jgi:hypothetical protein
MSWRCQNSGGRSSLGISSRFEAADVGDEPLGHLAPTPIRFGSVLIVFLYWAADQALGSFCQN